jgi:hypothetical protein
MKYIQKFNESLKTEEVLEDKFIEFIEKVEEMGELAHWEFKSGSGISDKDSALDVISTYGSKIKEINSLFEEIKSKIYDKFGIYPESRPL